MLLEVVSNYKYEPTRLVIISFASSNKLSNSKPLSKHFILKMEEKSKLFSVTIITKVKAISLTFCLLSIIMLVFVIIQISVNENANRQNFNQYFNLLANLLVLLTNLLLYQAILQITLGLKFWPNANYCLLSWILVHLFILGILFFNTLSYIYTLSKKTNFAIDSTSERRKEDETSRNIQILLTILLIMGQLLILFGIKVVTQFFEASNKDDSDEE